MACISMTIADGHGAVILSSVKHGQANANKPFATIGTKLDEEALKKFINVHQIKSNQDSEDCDEESDMTSEDDVILQFRIWEQGIVIAQSIFLHFFKNLQFVLLLPSFFYF